MSKRTNRREALSLLAGIGGAGTLGTFALWAGQAGNAAGAKTGLRALPWPYTPLDPDVVGQRAFDVFSRGGCMYGAFEAIAGSVAQQLGAPYTDFPFELAAYGAGGINGWGTICGALNGSAVAFQLLAAKPGPLVDALFAWAQSQELPNFRPKGAKFAEVRSITASPLCHQSIASWCKAAHKTAFCPERIERCQTLTASVARQAVVLLNEQAASKPAAFELPQATKTCLSCHGRNGAQADAVTKMDCGGCHAPLVSKHPRTT